ncbi:N-acetyltransferase family protein [Aeromicrobium camelliae]|uniref:N-acetyltransferase family protein n=1 Tax=Aeromicrobium camelliae TaxID=1538144 RepID=A0A3N6W3Y6_9ACTN|nr:GNAT family N-acetyltransferase [Aeromicrobium camelliae]RQN02239.1 N-acetyltransferase family protein [Aeromicrobium camelliae]
MARATTPATRRDGSRVTIRPMEASDWPAVETIYAEGIASGNATFESAPPSWERFDASRIAAGRLVAELDDTVVGWVAASLVSPREVYRGVVEHSIYVAGETQGHGVGRALLDAFIEATEAAGIWTIQSVIFPENTASWHLHERAGFRVVGTRERIAQMTYGSRAGQWRDTVLIERRSSLP